ncbi:TetR/AcrR family transcriptional regulator [Nonomuraea aridisoli]|uniref:TetR family transcriptional regulator n=1 Tax=Nonomuraea aridisoli TaxID=2070368 RepID=A0A2W2EIK4_9ACTN|nr:TetR/AcrR family transcriptional regulator [Nonomuraea aridisoli]PZG12078.1 TetR family transcriptional regulator [Nonomuraea aridisoli]
MTGATRAPRPAGRPRSQEADAAILAAALDLLIELGAQQVSIEQVARRAGVTRATVYRRFADKTALLVRALEWNAHAYNPGFTGWRDVEDMIADWAAYLSVPRHRRLLRRLTGSIDDYPELMATYRPLRGGQGTAAVDGILRQARDAGRLPQDADLHAVQEILRGAVFNVVQTAEDDAERIRAYFMTILKQTGYRAVTTDRERI